MIKFKASDWLLIDIANTFGKDKLTYITRLIWAKNNLDNLEDLIGEADKPNQYEAAVMAYREFQEDKPSGHTVELDSANSGIQLISTCLGCVTGMKNTGVINTGERPDAYSLINTVMGSDVPRQAVKDALMPYIYASDAEPEKVFGERVNEFYEAARVVAPAACEFRDLAKRAWQPYALNHSWVMSNGSTVFLPVMQQEVSEYHIPSIDRNFTFTRSVNQGKKTGISLGAHVTHSIDALVVMEVSGRCNHKYLEMKRIELMKRIDDTTVRDRTKFMSIDRDIDTLTTDNEMAQMIELIDRSLAHKAFPVLTVHDAFRCHCNNVQRMREVYNEVLHDLYNSDLLYDIIYQITGKKFNMHEVKEEVCKAILENDYSIN